MLLSSAAAVAAEEEPMQSEELISEMESVNEESKTIETKIEDSEEELPNSKVPANGDKDEEEADSGINSNDEEKKSKENDIDDFGDNISNKKPEENQDKTEETELLSAEAVLMNEVNEDKPTGTEEYELLYYNGFDTDEEKAKNPFKYYTYSSDTETPIAATSSGKIQFTLYNRQEKTAKAVFFDIEETFKDANNTSLLTAGELYEISFDLVVNWGPNKPSFGISPQKSFDSMKNAGGIGLNGTRYTLANASGKREEEVRFIAAYSPKNRYLVITDYEYYFSPTATIDNLTLRKIDVNEEFIRDNYQTLYNKLTSSSPVTMTNIAQIDLSSTKNVLIKGETADLIAYSQELPENAVTEDVINSRKLINNGELSVTSSNTGVVDYKDGKLEAVGIGTAVLEVSQGTNKSKMVVAVHAPDAEKMDFLTDRPINWLKVSNPCDTAQAVSACAYIPETGTAFDTASPIAIHYKKYFNGTEASMANILQPFDVTFGSRDMTNMLVNWGNYSAIRDAFKKYAVVGWNDFYLITSKANKNNDNSIKYYINGEYGGEIGFDVRSANGGKGTVRIYPCQNYNDAYKTVSTWDIYSAFEIVSIKEVLKTESVTITKDSGTVLKIEDISRIFSESPQIYMPVSGGFDVAFDNAIDEETLDNNIVLYDADGNVVEVKLSMKDSNTVAIRPNVLLTFNSKYTLKLKDGLKAAGKDVTPADKGQTADYVFITEKKPITYDKIIVDGNTLKVNGLSNNRDYEQTVSFVLAAYEGDKCVDTKIKNLKLNEYEKLSEAVELTTSKNISEYEFFAWNTVEGNDLKSLNMDNVILDTARSNVEFELLNGEKALYNVTYNAQTEKVTITGQTGQKMADSPVAVRIVPNGELPNESNILRIEEVKTGKDGAIGYTFGFGGENGKIYDVYINVNGEAPVICSFGYDSEENAVNALKKINSCTTAAQVMNVINDARKALGFVNDGFENVGAKGMICGSLLKNVPYSLTDGGIEAFDKTYNKALTLAKLLDEANKNTSDTIINNNEYWGIEKTSAYNKFKELSDTEKGAVYNTIKNAGSLSEINSSFATGVIVRAILSQASYSSVYAAMQEFDDIMNLDGTAYKKLKSSQQMNVCKKIVSESEGFTSIKAIENRFSELCAIEAKNGTSESTPGKTSGESSYSPGKSASAADGYSGVKVLPGAEQTTNPKPDWYVDETASESFTVFGDLENYDWAVSSIKKLYEAGAINGKAEGIFAPNDMITREELCKIITIAMGITQKDGAEVINFSDVDPNAWYAQYIDICNSRSIINGIGNNEFGVGKYVTREEAATILVRAAEAVGKSLDYYVTIFPFDDDDQISDWAKSSVEILRECQVINGVSETEAIFAPKNNVTRAAASKMIVGVMNFSY